MDRIPADWTRTCQKFRKGPACGNKTRAKRHSGRNAMERIRDQIVDRSSDRSLDRSLDQSLTSGPRRALEDAFHAMVARSRTEPAADLAERLDRLARLRAVVADNEERFRQAISADFGHRCTVETNIAETMMVYGEIRHASKHLKSWMAPQRVATALQFLPARNRLIAQ